MVHEARGHQQKPDRGCAQDGRQGSGSAVIKLYAQRVEKEDGKGRQQGVDYPGRAQDDADGQQEGIARRVHAVPAAVVDRVREGKKIPGAGRWGVEAARREQTGLEQIIDLVVDTGRVFENDPGEDVAENEHEGGGRQDRPRDLIPSVNHRSLYSSNPYPFQSPSRDPTDVSPWSFRPESPARSFVL